MGPRTSAPSPAAQSTSVALRRNPRSRVRVWKGVLAVHEHVHHRVGELLARGEPSRPADAAQVRDELLDRAGGVPPRRGVDHPVEAAAGAHDLDEHPRPADARPEVQVGRDVAHGPPAQSDGFAHSA